MYILYGNNITMNGKTFLNSLANGKSDIVQLFLDNLKKLKIDYCLIGFVN